MSGPRFMSHEHVAQMNALLEGRLVEECAALSGEHQLQYEISGDPDGIRTWTVTVSPASGMRFDLDVDAASPVAIVRDSYRSMADSSRAGREGREPVGFDPEYEMYDAEAFAELSAVVAASRAIATVDVDFGV